MSTSTGTGSSASRNVRGRGDAVEPRHADVHEDHIRAQGGQLLHGLLAVGAFGDHLEPVGRGEDSRQAGADDGLIVDEGNPDHRVRSSRSGYWVLRVQRKAAAHSPALRRRSGRELAAQRGRALPHPDQSVPGSLGLQWRCGDRRPGRVGDEACAPVGHLHLQHGLRVRRVLGRIGERLLGDPVERDSDARRDAGEVPARMQLDREATRSRMVDERGDVPHRREGRRHRPVLGATEQRNGASQFLHAASAYILRRPQRLLGGGGVPAQHVAGAGDLKHDSGQSVSDEVVDVARDPTPLGQNGLLRELASGGVKLGRELALASGRAADEPRESDAHDPDADEDLGRVLDQARHHRRGRRQQAERDCHSQRWGPKADDEGKQGHLEQKGLELPGSLCHDDRGEHCEGQREQRHVGHVGPHREGADRQRGKHEVGR